MRNDSRASIRETGVGQIELLTLPRARLIEREPRNSNTSLLGHGSIAFAGGWVVHKIPVFKTKSGTLSVGVPNAAPIGIDGKVKIKPDSSRSYKSIISFQSADARERWASSILIALADAGVDGRAE